MTQTPGETLRALRRGRHLTQKQVADLIGADKASVSAWELDEYAPRPATVVALDGALEAEGAVIRLYGLLVPSEDELLTRLSAAVETLAADLASLRATFDAHLAEVHEDGRPPPP